MRLKDLKETMLLPDREILINRSVKINDTDVLLISITSEQQTHRLWTLRKLPEGSDEEMIVHRSEEPLSNRDHLQESMISDGQQDYISKMIIQGQTMTFDSSESRYFREQDHEMYMRLQHFVEKGLELGSFAEVELERLFLTCYEQENSKPFPKLDLDKELDIMLKFNSTFRRIPIHTEPIVLQFGDSQKEIKHSFYDPLHDKNRFFYINALTRYDIWEEAEKIPENPDLQHFTDEERRQFKEQYIENLESVCAKGKELALIEYEAEGNVQLNFYTKEYLDAQPVYSSNSSHSVMFFKSDREVGHNGLTSRICEIGSVDNTFSGSLVVELMHYYAEFPEKTIKL
ncbi:hypothetical protein [Saccharibacillus kuerlensis]|uniref:Uncharacterized protein n=1 Tax=Saccharibacillus kuerlensis TaxID=459527 RepID=A0ABQ2L5J6_9BACL|nr:hypothetical protein [Saccharibacillus kuerlensis]GGO01999.1 hypothetical protein GCM10010969_24840 [Saccharibacillus kuerlensis]